MKKLLLLMFMTSPLMAGVHIMQGDPVTTSSVTITGTGIRFADGTVQVSSAPSGGGAGDIEGVTAGAGLSGGGTSGSVTLSVSAVSLSSQVVGNLPVTNLNSGTGATSSTFWRGDGAWVSSSTFGQGAGLTLSSFSATVPVLYNSGTGVFSATPISLSTGVVGVLPVANGGTNLTTASDDNVMVGNGTTWQSKAISDCDNATTSKLLYDAGTNAFSCGTDQDTGGLGSGATMYAQLNDLKVSRDSSTNLGIGASCSATSPCVTRVAGTVYRFLSSATVTLGGSSVTNDGSVARIYVDSAGVLTVGLDANFTAANVTCVGCTKASPISTFPDGSIPLYTWLAGTTDHQWDSSGESDLRASLSNDAPQAGYGIEINGTEVSVNSAVVPTEGSTITWTGSHTYLNQVNVSTSIAGVTKLQFSDGTSMTTAASGSGSYSFPTLTGKMAMIPFPEFPLKFSTNIVVTTMPVVQPLVVNSSMTVSRVTWYIGTALGASCSGGQCGIMWGIYDSDCSTLLMRSTPFTTSGTGSSVVSSTMTTATVINPGAYCLMLATDSQVVSVAAAPTSNAMDGITNHAASGGPRIGTCSNPTTGNGSNLTLPGSCGTITSSDRLWNGTLYP